MARVVGMHRVVGVLGMACGIEFTKGADPTVSRWRIQTQVVGESIVTIQTMAFAAPGDVALAPRVGRVQKRLVASVHS